MISSSSPRTSPTRPSCRAPAQQRLVLPHRDPPVRRGLVMGAAMAALDGMMQDWPLTVARIIDHAARMFPDNEVVTSRHSGAIVRTGYRSSELRVGNESVSTCSYLLLTYSYQTKNQKDH